MIISTKSVIRTTRQKSVIRRNFLAVTEWKKSASAPHDAESSSDGMVFTRRKQNGSMVMGVYPG